MYRSETSYEPQDDRISCGGALTECSNISKSVRRALRPREGEGEGHSSHLPHPILATEGYLRTLSYNVCRVELIFPNEKS